MSNALRFSFAALLIFAAALAVGHAAALPCSADSVAGHLDYAGDVYNFSSTAQEPGHDDYDIVEMRSCLEGTDIVLGLRVAGAIDRDHDGAFYGLTLF